MRSPPLFAVSLLVLVLATGGVVGCKSDQAHPTEAPLQRPAAVGALVRRALNAIRSGNASAYVALLATASEATLACPRRFSQHGEKKMRERWLRSLKKVREGVAHCWSLIPWEKAREISRQGGESGEVLGECKHPVRRLVDITLVFEAEGISYGVTLRRPYVRGEMVFGFADGPQCRHQPKAAHRK